MAAKPSTDGMQPVAVAGDNKDTMSSDVQTVRCRLKSLLVQLHSECPILERIIYKNKNQHRRSGYFQYLLKVRRDLRLLQSVKLEELSTFCFQVITDERPKQKIQLLESLKRGKRDGRKPNFLEHLLGAARLLSQVIEPMLKAAGEISILLAQSFFMGFSLTILALLARLRILIQQNLLARLFRPVMILLDVVFIFNMTSSLSQKRQSVKITHEGVEVFREFYPKNQEFITLECTWETDKFVLVERTHKSEISHPDKDLDSMVSLGIPSVHYESIESFLEEADEEPVSIPEIAEPKKIMDELPYHMEDKTEAMVEPPSEDTRIVTAQTLEVEPHADFSSPAPSSPPTPLQILDPLKLKSGTETKRVAFVSVSKPSPSKRKPVMIPLPDTRKSDGKGEDPFFNLLAGGNLRDSLF